MTDQSLAERVAAVRREHILDAATRVFAARGFNGATIRDVARAAGVADGTIYNYFANKDALLFGIFDRLNETERRQQDLTPPAGADPAMKRSQPQIRCRQITALDMPQFTSFDKTGDY